MVAGKNMKVVRAILTLFIIERLQTLVAKLGSLYDYAQSFHQIDLRHHPDGLDNDVDNVVYHRTGAFSNCTKPKNHRDGTLDYTSHVVVSCQLIGYNAPITIMAGDHLGTEKRSDGSSFRLIVGVLSHHQNQQKRNVIRETWGGSLKEGHQLYFIVASNNFEEVRQEYETHNDLIWLHMAEDDRKVSYTSSALVAILHKHASYTHLFKTNDDRQLTVDMIIQQTKQLDPSVQYAGCSQPWLKPIRPETNAAEDVKKFELTRKEYPEPEFAPYALGTGYVLTKAIGNCMSREMQRLRYVPIEDATVGLLVERCHFTLHQADYTCL